MRSRLSVLFASLIASVLASGLLACSLAPRVAGAQPDTTRWTPELTMQYDQITETAISPGGEQGAVRLDIEGTGEGEYLGHDVDGKSFQVSEIAIFHVSDGKLDEYWFQFDELGLWAQPGVLDRPYPEE